MFFACGRVRSLHCTHFVRSGRDDILGVCLRTLLFRSESVGDPSTTADASTSWPGAAARSPLRKSHWPSNINNKYSESISDQLNENL